MSAEQTRTVVNAWFAALDRGDIGAALECLDEHVLWENIDQVPGVSDIVPWLGTYRGRDGAATAFQVRDEVVQVKQFRLTQMMVEDDWAMGVVHEESLCKPTGKVFQVDFASTYHVVDGKIREWKSYCDSAPIVAAFRPNGATP